MRKSSVVCYGVLRFDRAHECTMSSRRIEDQSKRSRASVRDSDSSRFKLSFRGENRGIVGTVFGWCFRWPSVFESYVLLNLILRLSDVSFAFLSVIDMNRLFRPNRVLTSR